MLCRVYRIMAAAVRQAEVIVLGGGISGLAAAFYLRSPLAGSSEKIVVLEGTSRVGGWIDSFSSPEGAVHEKGTHSIRPIGVVGKNTLDLVSELGLESELIPVTRSHPATQNRFIYTPAGLHRLPSSLGGVVRRQSPFSQSLLSRLAREPFAPRCRDEDETIYSFLSRRLGTEIADYLGDPFCRGIFAGDARQLSMRACFPAVFDTERKHGSIIIGGLRSKPEKIPDVGMSELAGRAQKERWASWTMSGGLSTLTTRLSRWLQGQGVDIHRSLPCRKMEFQNREEGGSNEKVARVTTDEGVWEARHIVCSIPAHATHGLLPAEHGALSALLRQIESCTVGVVNLEFEALRLPVIGFGYLVPSHVPSTVLGVIFDSCAFPRLDSEGRPTTRLTCMMGGAWFNKLFGDPHQVDPDVLLTCALEGLRDQLGITQKPAFTNVTINHECIPQYRLGHSKLVDNIQSYIKDHQLPLTLVGASYRGVSVNDCIFQARQAVRQLNT